MQRILLFVVVIIFSCSQQNKKTIPASTTYDALLALMKDRINPYLTNMQLAEVKHVLDSIYPAVLSVDKYDLTIKWMLLKEAQHSADGNFDSARYYVDGAMRMAMKNDSNAKDMLLAKVKLANILAEEKSYDSALQYAREAYEQARVVDTILLPLICLRLYEIYAAIEDLESMGKYAFEGFQRSAGLPVYKTYFASSISDYYERMGEIDSAIAFFKFVENDTSQNNLPFEALKNENLGNLLAKKGKLKEAISYHEKALAMGRGIGQLNAQSYMNYSTTYRMVGKYKEALILLDSSMLLAQDQEDWTLIKEIWMERAIIYAAQFNYSKAYKASDSALSSYTTEVDSSIILKGRELETKYNVKSKEDQIIRLDAEKRVEQAISNQRKILLVGVSMATILLGLTGVFYVRRKREHYKVREAELLQQLLRTQMGPHFIFHFLSMLQDAILRNELEIAEEYLTKFSRLIRLSLENARKNFVYVKDEVEALINYISLQQMIVPSPFAFEIKVYPGYQEDDISIPPMLLQPFVENAILHGLAPIEYEGWIWIEIKKEGDVLRCTIEDNGVGIKNQLQQKKESFAGKIIQERLEILKRQTGQRSELTILDKKSALNGSGTKVLLTIPVR